MVSLGFARRLGKALLDFVYPPACAACRQAILDAGEWLCAACWQRLPAVGSAHCRRCGCPATREVEVCGNCAHWTPVFQRAVVLGGYDGALQQAIHALKFEHRRQLGRALGRCMGQVCEPRLAPVDLLVPVPLHPARKRERGYNQSRLIAQGLGEVLGVEVVDTVLKRRINTRQQAQLDARRRQENLHASFGCTRTLPEHGCIGLVDDVLTTGATLNACAQVLIDSGARRVWALALACPFRQPGVSLGGNPLSLT